MGVMGQYSVLLPQWDLQRTVGNLERFLLDSQNHLQPEKNTIIPVLSNNHGKIPVFFMCQNLSDQNQRLLQEYRYAFSGDAEDIPILKITNHWEIELILTRLKQKYQKFWLFASLSHQKKGFLQKKHWENTFLIGLPAGFAKHFGQNFFWFLAENNSQLNFSQRRLSETIIYQVSWQIPLEKKNNREEIFAWALPQFVNCLSEKYCL